MKTDVLFGALLAILGAIPRTLLFSLIVLFSGILLGSVIAIIRMKKIRVLSPLLTLLTAYLRGTPLVVQLYIVYYSLPELLAAGANALLGLDLHGYDISPWVTLSFTFILYAAAYQSENIRGALNSVELGQTEACYSIGMTELQAMQRVVFPQALAVAIPNFFSFYLSILKQCSLAFLFQVVDILAAAKLYSALTSRFTECYVAAAIIYWILGILLNFVFHRWELHAQKGRVPRVSASAAPKSFTPRTAFRTALTKQEGSVAL